MKKVLLIAAIALTPTLAFAWGADAATGACEKFGDLYHCPLPKAPEVVKCQVVFGELICNHPVDAEHKPANCGWHRGHYVCV